MKNLKKSVAFVKTLLGIKEIPIEGGKTNFSEEQTEKLKDKLGDDMSEKLIKAIDKEATNILEREDTNEELAAVREELQTALADTNISEDEAINLANAEGKGDNGKPNAQNNETEVQAVIRLTSQLIESNKRQDQLIQKLINDPEGDSPDATGDFKREHKVRHSNTHLFASDKAFNAFEGRNWNKRAAGVVKKKTNWASSSGVEIQKLNEDLDHYFRENPEAIKSLHRDNFGLPSFWPKHTKVTDEVSDASIVSAEITQARKLNWLPKNKQAIKAETGKIFPVQIDIEFVGKMLQDMEATWLSKFVAGGSSPYKESFVAFLVSELDKKARAEDRMSSIKAVYVETPDDATTPGRAINRQDGLLIQLYRAYHIDKKFKSANVGAPTSQNIVDYVPKVIESNLKEEVKNETNLVFYWSPSWERAYKTRYRQLHGTETDFDGDTLNIENYPNIKFKTLVDLEGTDFMFITFDNNIEILENIPEEKSLYRFERLLRTMYVLGDYKLGIRMKHIGNKVKDGDPDEFKVQTVWTNNMPMFRKDFFIPLHKNATGEITAAYSNMQVTDDFNTDIVNLDGTFKGQVIKIRGNKGLTASRKVKNNPVFDLTADFDLQSGGTLTLYSNGDGTYKELSRTAEPEVITHDNYKLDSDVVDAVNGSDQTFVGDAATTVAEIINGVENQELTIVAGKNAAALTVQSVSGNINLASNALLDAEGDKLSLVFVDGIWIETSREIAA